MKKLTNIFLAFALFALLLLNTNNLMAQSCIVNAGGNQTIMLGQSTILHGSGNTSAFSWSPTNGLSNPNIVNPTASPTTTTTYTLTGTSGSIGVIHSTAIPTIVLKGNPGCTPIEVGYNPINNLYYSVGGGSSSCNIMTYDATGTQQLLTTNSGHDWRGLWWNPNLNSLEGNACSGCPANGIRIQTLNGSGYALNTGVTVLPPNQPDFQSQGDLDYTNNEIIYYNAGLIHRKSRSTGANLSNLVISGLPVSQSFLNLYIVGYSGVSGAEYMVYDYVNKRVYFINRITGAFVGSSQLPSNTPNTGSTWSVGFANGQVWIFNGTGWNGYEVAVKGISCTATSTVTITVVECTAPGIIPPQNIIANANDEACGASVNFNAEVTGSPTPTIIYSIGSEEITSPHSFPVGTTNVTVVATNTCASMSSSFTVTVEDNVDPIVIGLPTNIDALNDPGVCGAVIEWAAPTASDNCSATIAQTSGPPSGSIFPIGPTIVTYTATDASGNSASGSFTITVSDTEIPAIVDLPTNIVKVNDPGVCGAEVEWVAPTATDNCSATIAQTDGPASGSTFPVGVTTITYTASDESGNSVSGSFTITVTDNEVPVILDLPANIIAVNDRGVCGAKIKWATPKASDNCAAKIDQKGGPPNGSFFPVGVSTITYIAGDASGNYVSGSFTVTVIDTERPAIVGLPTNIFAYNDPGACGAMIKWPTPKASDNCAATIVQTGGPPIGSSFPIGVTTVTYTAKDVNGNSVSESFVVGIKDKDSPVITTNGNQIVSTSAGICGALVDVHATATDNCGVGLPSGARSDGLAVDEVYPVGSTTITWSVTDVNGLTAFETQTVTVTNSAPIINSVTSSDADGLFEVGAEVSLSITYVDSNGKTALINWDDGNSQTVSNPATTFTVNHTYGSAGVYSVGVSVIDACGLTANYLFEYLVAYDPSSGFVTGGGWIDSPPDAYTANPSLTGKANFGFVSKYQKGSTVPTGDTEFQFKAGNLNFNSTSYQWLVVAGNKAQFRGKGTINGAGNYKFLLTAIDGAKNPDKFRIRILDSRDAVIYDNQQGLGEDSDAATIIGGGSIVIHNPKSGSSARYGSNSDGGEGEETNFDPSSITVYPMPFKDQFYVYVPGPAQESLHLQLLDITGKELIRKEGKTNTYIEVDSNGLKSGMYLIKVLKANGFAVRKIVKQ